MPDFLTLCADGFPDKLAVVDDRPDGAVAQRTFAELDAGANRLARGLASLGIQPGDKVVWCGQNSIAVVTIIHGARKLGATAVPLNYRLSPEEAAYVTDHSDAVAICTQAEFAPMFATIRRDIPKIEHFVVFDGAVPAGMLAAADVVAGQPADPCPEPDPEDAGATMIYTSGTTGRPKGAFRRGAGNPVAAEALVRLIGYVPEDVYLTTGPLYHSGPGGFMVGAHALGNTVVLQRRFDPVDWLRLVESYGVTTTFSAPAPIRMICALPEGIKAKFDRSSMKRMIANAAPWSFALKQRYLADFPADSLWEVYGSTELGVNCILEPGDQLRKPGSCGKAAPLVEVGLFDDDGNVVTGTGPDHPGELYVRSDDVFDDYYKQHDRYEDDTRGDFHTVGDIAYRDDEGYYYICDRKKDMVISGGMNIYPAEIEAALETHPDVYDVAVFGIPSEDWGESVHAVVVARPGAALSEGEVRSYARQHLAGYKVPRSVSFMEELPRTGSGKLLKRELRAPYWAGRDVQVG